MVTVEKTPSPDLHLNDRLPCRKRQNVSENVGWQSTLYCKVYRNHLKPIIPLHLRRVLRPRCVMSLVADLASVESGPVPYRTASL